jgi:hypothetical protein
MKYFLFFLITYSAASIIVEQKIFEESRNWLKTCSAEHSNFFIRKACQLVSCISCTGFWCGFFITLLGLNIFNIGFIDPFFGGLAGSAGSYIISIFVLQLEKTVGDEL